MMIQSKIERGSMKTPFPVISIWVFLDSQGQLTVVSGPIWPKFEFVRDFMHVLLTCKYKKGSDRKQSRKDGNRSDLSQNLMQPPPANPHISTPPPTTKKKKQQKTKKNKKTTDKFWQTGLDDIFVHKCVRRTSTTDARALLYYKLTLWAFGSGELTSKQNISYLES